MDLAPRGIWLRASALLERPVPGGEPYPHICHVAGRRDCAACALAARPVQDVRWTEEPADFPRTLGRA
jgi:hypothetical protein